MSLHWKFSKFQQLTAARDRRNVRRSPRRMKRITKYTKHCHEVHNVVFVVLLCDLSVHYRFFDEMNKFLYTVFSKQNLLSKPQNAQVCDSPLRSFSRARRNGS